MNHRTGVALLTLALVCMTGPTAAETGELRFAKQTSIKAIYWIISSARSRSDREIVRR